MTDALRDEVVRGASTGRIRRLAQDVGMGSLAEDARRQVAEGVTTPHEVGRVLQSEPGAALPCRSCGRPCPADSVGCPWCGLARGRACGCGAPLESGWRFCPACLRKQ
jgi:hypothetical protein